MFEARVYIFNFYLHLFQGETVQNRVHKSLKVWSLYADLEESFGTFKVCMHHRSAVLLSPIKGRRDIGLAMFVSLILFSIQGLWKYHAHFAPPGPISFWTS